MSNKNQLIIYQTSAGKVKIKTFFEKDTIWLPTEQIAELFKKNRSLISRHIMNIFKKDELKENWSNNQ